MEIIDALKGNAYVLGANTTTDEVKVHYDIPYNGHRYMALVSIQVGDGWYGLDEDSEEAAQTSGIFTYPKITQRVNGNIVFEGKASHAALGRFYRCVLDSQAGDTLEFDITYKHEGTIWQSVPLGIVWFD